MSLSPCCSSPPLSSFSLCPLSRLFSIFQPSPFLSLLFSLYLLSFLSSLHFRILFSIFQQAPFPLLLILYQPLFLPPPPHPPTPLLHVLICNSNVFLFPLSIPSLSLHKCSLFNISFYCCPVNLSNYSFSSSLNFIPFFLFLFFYFFSSVLFFPQNYK